MLDVRINYILLPGYINEMYKFILLFMYLMFNQQLS